MGVGGVGSGRNNRRERQFCVRSCPEKLYHQFSRDFKLALPGFDGFERTNQSVLGNDCCPAHGFELFVSFPHAQPSQAHAAIHVFGVWQCSAQQIQLQEA